MGLFDFLKDFPGIDYRLDEDNSINYNDELDCYEIRDNFDQVKGRYEDPDDAVNSVDS